MQFPRQSSTMLEDLNSLLQKWPFEAGSLQVRTIQGQDGRTKLQFRVDLGILQMETKGRPDGLSPFGHNSLLEYYETFKSQQEKKGEIFKLGIDDTIKLQQESLQYYHRYLAFFHLEDFEAVIRDVEHNLRLFDFISNHSEEAEAPAMVQHFRPYVLMMRTRARGLLALKENDYPLALKHIDWGIQEIHKFLQDHFPIEAVEQNPELNFLKNWMQEVQEQRPLTPLEKLQKQMLDAIKKEDYERAARLRDALKELG